MTLIIFFLILTYATKVINLHCQKCRSRNLHSKAGLIYTGLVFTVCALACFSPLCVRRVCVCAHMLLNNIFFSPERVTFNLNGFVSHLAQQNWKKNLQRNSTASLNTVLLPLTGKIQLFRGKSERLEAAHVNYQNPTKVNFQVRDVFKQQQCCDKLRNFYILTLLLPVKILKSKEKFPSTEVVNWFSSSLVFRLIVFTLDS